MGKFPASFYGSAEDYIQQMLTLYTKWAARIQFYEWVGPTASELDYSNS